MLPAGSLRTASMMRSMASGDNFCRSNFKLLMVFLIGPAAGAGWLGVHLSRDEYQDFAEVFLVADGSRKFFLDGADQVYVTLESE